MLVQFDVEEREETMLQEEAITQNDEEVNDATSDELIEERNTTSQIICTASTFTPLNYN